MIPCKNNSWLKSFETLLPCSTWQSSKCCPVVTKISDNLSEDFWAVFVLLALLDAPEGCLLWLLALVLLAFALEIALI